MARHQDRNSGSDVVARLLEAERVWADALGAARAASGEKIRAARDEAARIAETAAAETERAIDRRKREAAASSAAAIEELTTVFDRRVADYRDASERAVDAAAAMVASLAPWLRAAETSR